MLVPVYNVSGEKVGERELPESVFGVEPNETLMHQALVRQLANARLGTHDTKTRGEISGGGRKPWRQKGTGRARQGSIRSPLWRGGGTVFGPTPRKYTQAMPRKMYRAAICSALSVKIREGLVTLVEGLSLSEPRTKEMVRILSNLGSEKSALVALGQHDANLELASRNIEGVKMILAPYLNVRDLFQYDRLVLPVEALAVVESWLGGAEK